jgi:hypothetical protein
MNIREISDVFKDTANQITAIKSYNFGWPSDRTRSSNTEDYQELNEFPRVFFSVPTITGSDQTRKQDTYQVTLFFDDLLGYNNEGDADLTLQLDKWATLQVYATAFLQKLNKIKQSILPNYIFIPDAPAMTFDSFTGLQRMITVQLSFTLVVPTNCEPVVSKLVECIANIVTSSNLTAALKNIFELTSSLQASSSLSANLQLTRFAASSLNANASLNASALVSKLAASSLTGAGTLAANLTVTGGGVLLLDLYPNAAAAYSLRKLRTAYTGSAIQVRRSSDNNVQDIGFTALGVLDESALTTFCGSGNGFVTTWYDQSVNAINASQGTALNQPQIVSSGVVILLNAKPSLQFDNTSDVLITSNSNNFIFNNYFYITHVNSFISYSGYPIVMSTTSDGNGTDGFWLEYGSNRGFTVCSNRLVRLEDNIVSLTSLSTNIQRLFTILQNNVGMSGFFNTTQFGSSVYTASIGQTNRPLYISGNISSNQFANMRMQEIIIYGSDKSVDRTNISTNINTHYAIY